MGQIARQLANGFRDILLGMRKDDIGKKRYRCSYRLWRSQSFI